MKREDIKSKILWIIPTLTFIGSFIFLLSSCSPSGSVFYEYSDHKYEAVDLGGKALRLYDLKDAYVDHPYDVGDTVLIKSSDGYIYERKHKGSPRVLQQAIITKLK